MKSNKKIIDCDLFVSTIGNFITGLTKRLRTYVHRKACKSCLLMKLLKCSCFIFIICCWTSVLVWDIWITRITCLSYRKGSIHYEVVTESRCDLFFSVLSCWVGCHYILTKALHKSMLIAWLQSARNGGMKHDVLPVNFVIWLIMWQVLWHE